MIVGWHGDFLLTSCLLQFINFRKKHYVTMSERCSYIVCVIFCMLININPFLTGVRIFPFLEHTVGTYNVLQLSLTWSSASILTTNTPLNQEFQTGSIGIFNCCDSFCFDFVNEIWISLHRQLATNLYYCTYDLLQSSLIWSSASILTTNTPLNQEFQTDSIDIFDCCDQFCFDFVNDSWISLHRLATIFFVCVNFLLASEKVVKQKKNQVPDVHYS